MKRARVLFAALLLAPCAAACDNGPLPTTPETPTPVVTSPVTETFNSQINVGGYVFRSFNAAKAGTATATLTTLSGASSLKVGFALGILDSSGSGCLYTKSMETGAGGSLTAAVDAGTYCIRVYDIGALTTATPFTVTIVRP
jgi:hypothetical protein